MFSRTECCSGWRPFCRRLRGSRIQGEAANRDRMEPSIQCPLFIPERTISRFHAAAREARSSRDEGRNGAAPIVTSVRRRLFGVLIPLVVNISKEMSATLRSSPLLVGQELAAHRDLHPIALRIGDLLHTKIEVDGTHDAVAELLVFEYDGSALQDRSRYRNAGRCGYRSLHHDGRADRYPLVEICHVRVPHPETAG